MTYRHVTITDSRAAPPVSRRAFLTLHVSEGKRVLELSCETLYMRYQDACSEAGRRQVSNHDDLPPAVEPSLGFGTLTPAALFAELEQQLAAADELRVLEREWLNSGAFGREVTARVDAFRQRGRPVAFGRVAPEPTVNGALKS